MPLLSLPVEIHHHVFRLILENAVIHIQDRSDTRRCQTNPGICPYSTCSRDQALFKSLTKTKNLAALSMTCRQLRGELQADLYHHALLVFVSAEAFQGFAVAKSLHSDVSLFSIQILTKIHLDIGPGKHTEWSNWTAVEETLKLLAQEAAGLKILSLSTRYYFGADADTIPLSDDALILLLNFRGLKDISIFMYGRPPGPVGGSHGPEAVVSIDKKLQCLGQILVHRQSSKRCGRFPGFDEDTEVLAGIKQLVKNRMQEESKVLNRSG